MSGSSFLDCYITDTLEFLSYSIATNEGSSSTLSDRTEGSVLSTHLFSVHTLLLGDQIISLKSMPLDTSLYFFFQNFIYSLDFSLEFQIHILNNMIFLPRCLTDISNLTGPNGAIDFLP